jgi:hypothetical protein
MTEGAGLRCPRGYHAVFAVNDAQEPRAAWPRSSIVDGCAAAWGGGHRAIPPCSIKAAVMTTLYVRDQSGFREAQPTDVLDRAHALLTQRYRVGSPVLTSPALTREFLRVHLGTCEHEVLERWYHGLVPATEDRGALGVSAQGDSRQSAPYGPGASGYHRRDPAGPVYAAAPSGRLSKARVLA